MTVIKFKLNFQILVSLKNKGRRKLYKKFLELHHIWHLKQFLLLINHPRLTFGQLGCCYSSYYQEDCLLMEIQWNNWYIISLKMKYTLILNYSNFGYYQSSYMISCIKHYKKTKNNGHMP